VIFHGILAAFLLAVVWPATVWCDHIDTWSERKSSNEGLYYDLSERYYEYSDKVYDYGDEPEYFTKEEMRALTDEVNPYGPSVESLSGPRLRALEHYESVYYDY
jgi:hypothetical protein